MSELVSLGVLFLPSEGLRELKPSGCERSWPMPLPSPKFPWLSLSHARSFLPCSPSLFSLSLFTRILPSDTRTLTFFCLSQFFYVRPHSHAITHLPTRTHQESFFCERVYRRPIYLRSTWDAGAWFSGDPTLKGNLKRREKNLPAAASVTLGLSAKTLLHPTKQIS